MSLYRQAGGPSGRLAIGVGLAALVLGGAAGFAIGRGTAPEPTLDELIADARTGLRPALSAIELVGIEYGEGVDGGEVVAETEYEAARSQAQVAVDTLAAADDLRALDPDGVAAAEREVARVQELVGQRADEQDVDAALDAASEDVSALSGEPAP